MFGHVCNTIKIAYITTISSLASNYSTLTIEILFICKPPYSISPKNRVEAVIVHF